MVGLFLSPQGRATTGQFWVGVIVLLVVGLALSLPSNFGLVDVTSPESQSLQMVLLVVSIALIYPQLCVYAKRFHDAGKSAWWFLAVIGVSILLNFIVGIMLTIPYFPQLAAAQGDQEAMIAIQASMQEKIVWPATGVGIVIGLIVAFVVGNLRSDPGENKYGPPPGSGQPT
jgi:uncharacterized membrane protein YhaH (DUF805 family)